MFQKLAASGQLITNKSSGSRTTGFKRTAKAMKAPVSEEKLFNELDDEAFLMKETPRVSKNEDEIDISQVFEPFYLKRLAVEIEQLKVSNYFFRFENGPA